MEKILNTKASTYLLVNKKILVSKAKLDSDSKLIVDIQYMATVSPTAKPGHVTLYIYPSLLSNMYKKQTYGCQ